MVRIQHLSPDGVPNANCPYLDIDEGPKIQKVTVLTGSGNYPKWYREMSVLLAKKDKVGFINGTIPVPAKTDDANYESWKRFNDSVLPWIVKYISAEVAGRVNRNGMVNVNAVELWRALKEHYSPGNILIISDLMEEIYSLRQGELPVVGYFREFMKLWEQREILYPCACNWREEEKIARFLKGLNIDDAARSRIIREVPLPYSIENVFAKVVLQLEEETDKKEHKTQLSVVSATPSQEYKLLVLPIHPHPLTLKPPGAPYKCSGCDELGFESSYCCEVCNCYVIHPTCAGVVDKALVHHPLLPDSNLLFYDKPPAINKPRICDACRKAVTKFVYYCEHTDVDLHPRCVMLKRSVSDEEGSVTLELRETIPIDYKCLKCNKRNVDGIVPGWSYVSSDHKDYCYHVSCFKEHILENYEKGYFHKQEISGDTHQLVPVSSKENIVVKGGRKLSKPVKMLCKIGAVVFKLIFSAIFGDPVSLVLGLVEALALA